MKSLGIARKVDSLGRIVLPAELRKLLDIADGDFVEIFVDGDHIVLAKLEEHCVFCGAITELREFESKLVCRSCVARLTGTPAA